MLISIVTINYNNKIGLIKTLDSVFSQNIRDFEHIIIDGGSTDGGAEVIANNSTHLSYWVSEPDSGIYHAMNKGIAASSGDYLLFLNSGDVFLDPGSLHHLVAVAGRHDIIYGDLQVIGHRSYIKPYPDTLSLAYFLVDSIPHPATLIRRELFSIIGLYDEALKITSDWKFFLCAVCKHGATYLHINKVIAQFCHDGISSLASSKQLIADEKSLVLSKEFFLRQHDLAEIRGLCKLEKRLRKSRLVTFMRCLRLLPWLDRYYQDK